MSSESPRWAVLSSHFQELVDSPREQRPALLRDLDVDEDLRAELEALLVAHERDEELPAEGLWRELGEARIRPERKSIGGYRLLSLLGEGGMGEVWLAEREDPEFKHQVALKRIRTGLFSEELRQRFAIERQALARLSHRNIALLLDGGIDPDGIPFLVLEYVEGEPITMEADRRGLDIEARLDLFISVCEAVAYAHANLVVHRDLKPSNILLTSAGEIRLLDFGIAKLLDPELGGELGRTQTLHRLATPEYASPEQLQGGQITIATDVYSLGLLFFQLLTGHRPYREQESSLSSLEQAVCFRDAPRPSEVVAGAEGEDPDAAVVRGTTRRALVRLLRGDLDTIVGRALHRDASRRYPSVERLAEDLSLWRQGRPIWARPDSSLYQLNKFVHRHRGAMVVALSFLALLISFAAYAVRQSAVVAAERDAARLERDTATEVSNFITSLFSADPFADDEGVLASTTVGEFLEQTESYVRLELKDRPGLRAALLVRLGRFQTSLGNLQRGESLARDSLELRRSMPGDSRVEVAESLTTLGAVYRELRELEAAEELLREALALRRAAHGPGHPEVAESVHNLGLLLSTLDARGASGTEAEALIREAVSLRSRLFGAEHLDTVQSLNALASFLLDRKQGDDLREAEDIFRRILPIRERRLGSEHPSVATLRNNFANLLDDIGKEEEAIVLFRLAIQGWSNALGADHALVANGYYGLAEALEDLGDLRAAEEALRTSLAIDEQALPAGHPFLAASRLRLGEILVALERFDQAIPELRRALDSYRAQGDSPETEARAASLLGEALQRHGSETSPETSLQETAKTP